MVFSPLRLPQVPLQPPLPSSPSPSSSSYFSSSSSPPTSPSSSASLPPSPPPPPPSSSSLLSSSCSSLPSSSSSLTPLTPLISPPSPPPTPSSSPTTTQSSKSKGKQRAVDPSDNDTSGDASRRSDAADVGRRGEDVSGKWGEDVSRKRGEDVSKKRGEDVSGKWGEDVSGKWGEDVSKKRGEDVSGKRGGDVSGKRGEDVSGKDAVRWSVEILDRRRRGVQRTQRDGQRVQWDGKRVQWDANVDVGMRRRRRRRGGRDRDGRGDADADVDGGGPARRDEGAGGLEGVVVDLEMVGSGVYEVAYVVNMKFGRNDQQFQLQVDTGSSDLWVASAGCSTASCGQTGGRLYNPSTSSVPTGHDFSIPYLFGKAAGPVVWDRVTVGQYTIENQAFAAANDVVDEPLGPSFVGILGLALPLNSIIADSIPPVTDNTPDGAAWASNLFSITPIENSPAARFLSLALQRPGSDRVPSLLGIGKHPSALVPDPSLVKYTTLVSERIGTLFWKVTVRAISVYVDGVVREVDVGRSNTGAVFPSAVVDSGVPLILTTSRIANAIYGAVGVGPGSDGIYYVPCTTPLNLTITIDTLAPIPIHPLDLTSEPPQDNRAQFCIGLIQAADAQLSRPDNSIGDMILGVPFMRNVYTVMAYDVPNADGSFGATTTVTATATATGTGTGTVPVTTPVTNGGNIRPRIGFLSLTDPTIALSEFHTVRVLNQPIPPANTSSSAAGGGGNNGAGGAGTGVGGGGKTLDVGGKKVGVGIVVLIALMSFFALCGVLFIGRWVVMRRRFGKGGVGAVGGRGWFGARNAGDGDEDEEDEGARGADGVIDKKSAYRLARRTSAINGRSWSGRLDGGGISEDELRDMRYSAFLDKEREREVGRGGSESTMGSGRTKVGGGEFGDAFEDAELGKESVLNSVGVGLRSKPGRGRSRGAAVPVVIPFIGGHANEFGARESWRDEVRDVEDVDETWDPRTALSWPKEVKKDKRGGGGTARSKGWGDETLVGRGRTMEGKGTAGTGTGVSDSLVKNRDRSSRSPPEPGYAHASLGDVDLNSTDTRAWGDEATSDKQGSVHRQMESVDQPLLQHVSVPSGDSMDMSTGGALGMRGSVSSPAALHIPFKATSDISSSSRTATPTQQSQTSTPFTHAHQDSFSSWVSQTSTRLKTSTSTPTPPPIPLSTSPIPHVDEFGVPSTTAPTAKESMMAGVGRSRTTGMPLFVQPRPSISSQHSQSETRSIQDGRESIVSASSVGSGAGMAMLGFAVSSDESASTGVGVYATPPPVPLGRLSGGAMREGR